MVPCGKNHPPGKNLKKKTISPGKIYPPPGEKFLRPQGKSTHPQGGHFLKTQFLYKKIYAQQSAPKPPYVGRMNVGRGDRGESYPGRATRYLMLPKQRRAGCSHLFFLYLCSRNKRDYGRRRIYCRTSRKSG